MRFRRAPQAPALTNPHDMRCIVGVIRDLQRLHERGLPAVIPADDQVHPAEALHGTSTDAAETFDADGSNHLRTIVPSVTPDGATRARTAPRRPGRRRRTS